MRRFILVQNDVVVEAIPSDGQFGELGLTERYDVIAVDFSDTYEVGDPFNLTEFNSRNNIQVEAPKVIDVSTLL